MPTVYTRGMVKNTVEARPIFSLPVSNNRYCQCHPADGVFITKLILFCLTLFVQVSSQNLSGLVTNMTKETEQRISSTSSFAFTCMHVYIGESTCIQFTKENPF
jgi:hypothetical protein